jgi:dienelactone hydrolase
VRTFLLLSLIPIAVIAQEAPGSTAHLFDYDSKQALDLHDKVVEEFDGGAVHDVSYTSPGGGAITAYLVVPDGKGPFGAVLFGHWANGTRTEFLAEAKTYAKAGAVCLLPDHPWDRPAPWRKAPNHYDQPELDRAIEIQAVVELRRGIDVLLARHDVDGQRLAYVGHSFGAQWGSILASVDRRMKTVVLMAGTAEAADIFVRGQEPGVVALRKSQPAGRMEKYSLVLGDIDAIHFVGHASPIPLFLQFGNLDRYFDKSSMQRYAAAASEPKRVVYYNAGHDLNDPQAVRDRLDWLIKYIGLRPEPLPR